MFTGLVESTGHVAVTPGRKPGRLEIHCNGTLLKGVAIGDSIAVNGTCLTVTTTDGERVSFDLSRETVKRAAAFRQNAKVNLERAMQIGDRLGGHFVTGHVDGTATVVEIDCEGEACRMRLTCPPALMKHITPKGCVTLAGVSLTVCEQFSNGFDVQLVPHTLSHTVLGNASPGDKLNMETDLLAKYIDSLRGF